MVRQVLQSRPQRDCMLHVTCTSPQGRSTKSTCLQAGQTLQAVTGQTFAASCLLRSTGQFPA